MSGKASGCWLGTVTPELPPVVCSRQGGRFPPVVLPLGRTAREDTSSTSPEDATRAAFSSAV